MKIKGRLTPPKSGEKYWGVEIADLGIYTQGKSRKNALFMAGDAIALDLDNAACKIVVEPVGETKFLVSGSDAEVWVAYVLRCLRIVARANLMELSEKLGSKSPNAYGRYEQGRTAPSLAKLEELIRAVNPDYEIVLQKKTG